MARRLQLVASGEDTIGSYGGAPKRTGRKGSKGKQVRQTRATAPQGHGNGNAAPRAPQAESFEKNLTPKNQAQADYMHAIDSADIAFGIGPAGTGKTFIAVSKAVELLKAGTVQRIVLCRPAVEAGERLGFLPGGMQEKVDPYMRPLYDVLHNRLGARNVQAMMEHDIIEIAPLAFMRGRTFLNSAIVLDEAQNATFGQLQMFLTRFGLGSKMVVCGDGTQIDILPADSGLEPVARQFERGVHNISVSRFGEADVVRHAVISAMLPSLARAQSEMKSLLRAA